MFKVLTDLISSELCTKHTVGKKGIHVCANERPKHFPKVYEGQLMEIVMKMH